MPDAEREQCQVFTTGDCEAQVALTSDVGNRWRYADYGGVITLWEDKQVSSPRCLNANVQSAKVGDFRWFIDDLRNSMRLVRTAARGTVIASTANQAEQNAYPGWVDYVWR